MKNASCDCKGSALGRYNHAAGLLFALLDCSEKGLQSCTSKLCEWNVGRKVNRPKVLHATEYASISGKPVDREKKKAVEIMIFDSRAPSLRFPADMSCVNRFISNLKLALKGEEACGRIIPALGSIKGQIELF